MDYFIHYGEKYQSHLTHIDNILNSFPNDKKNALLLKQRIYHNSIKNLNKTETSEDTKEDLKKGIRLHENDVYDTLLGDAKTKNKTLNRKFFQLVWKNCTY